jgi:hypothetical protein
MALTRSEATGMATPHCWALSLLVGSLLTGCSRVQEDAPGTGAKERALTYFEALIHKDWPRAHGSLDPQSQQRCNSQQFTRLAKSYRDQLGFEPEAVQVWACEERGGEATVHVVLTGHTGDHHRRHKDALTLRRNDDWGVVLPPIFGQAKKR